MNPIFVVAMIGVVAVAIVAIAIGVWQSVNAGANTSEPGKRQTSTPMTQRSSAAAGVQAASNSATSSDSSASPSKVSNTAASTASAASPDAASAAFDTASYHVETADFAFDIPEYWRGKVDWKTWEEGGHSHAIVFPKTASGYVEGYHLVQLDSVDPSKPKYAGDYENHNIANVEDAGKRVDVSSKNWPTYYTDLFYSNPNYAGSSQESELMNALIDLCCGGKDLPDVRDQAKTASSFGEAAKVYGVPDADFLMAEFVPSVVIVPSPPANQQSSVQSGKAAEPVDYSGRAQEIARALFTNATDPDGAYGPMVATGSAVFGLVKPGSEASTSDQLEKLKAEGYLVIARQTELIEHDDIQSHMYGIKVVYERNLNVDGTNRRANIAEVYLWLDEEGLAERIIIDES